jgi:ATP-dependent Clp protease ATP-binding subunit ClpA
VAKLGHGTLLFDEIEKAHPLVLDLFLQILDTPVSQGRKTDQRLVDGQEVAEPK